MLHHRAVEGFIRCKDLRMQHLVFGVRVRKGSQDWALEFRV